MLLVLTYLAFLIAGGATLRAAFHIPHDSGAVAYVAKQNWSIRWGSFCEMVSAIPLGLFVFVVVNRLRSLRVRSAGVAIALGGGIGAMIMMILSSGDTWSLTRPGIAEATGAVRALEAVGFAAAGPGFVAMLGLFVAGVSFAASRDRLIPRWLMWLGFFVAAACEFAMFTLLFWDAGYLIPVGRFISIIWMIGVAATLPASGIADRDSDSRRSIV